MERKEWHIRAVDKETQRKIKVYAAAQGISLGEAIARLAVLAEAQTTGRKGRNNREGV